MPRHKHAEPALCIKIILEANGRLLAAIRHQRQHLILERQRVLFAVDGAQVEKDAVVGGQVPRPVLARSALACESCAPERLGVQCAVETG